MNRGIDSTVSIFRDVRVIDSAIGHHTIIGDNSDILRSDIGPHCRIGRRNLIIDSQMGEASYTGCNSVVTHVDIGKYCCISWNVSIGGDHHNYNSVCMLDDYHWEEYMGVRIGDEEKYNGSPGCSVGNGIWIGAGANILTGVTIGDGAVVGASAVVIDDVPPYSIVAGVPAKVIKYRFSPETIARLQSIQWWSWSRERIIKHFSLLHRNLNREALEALEQFAELYQENWVDR